MKQMTKREFIQKHDELKKKFKEAKRALKHVYSLTMPLVRGASKLYKQGINFYVKDEKGHSMPAFKRLDSLMDDLEFWRTIDVDLTF